MRWSNPIVALLLLAALHALVDTFALFTQPLWPTFEKRFATDAATIQLAFVAWNMTNSAAQLLFGYWGDRYQGRWLLWIGPLLGMLCICGIGLVQTSLGLIALLMAGGLGIAAFHPEAAALAGRLTPEHRSRAMSIFAVGGYLGQAMGPYYSGEMTTRYGMTALTWSASWGLVILALLISGIWRASAVDHHVRKEPVSLRRLLHGRYGAVSLLLTVGVLRVITSVGVPMALAFVIDAQGGTPAETGHVQSGYQLGIGLGSIACAALVSARNERLALWLTPMASTPLLWLACDSVGAARIAYMTAAGTAMGGAFPVLISYGQQLLPEGPRVASSLTMGVTWGFGSLIVAGVMAVLGSQGHAEWAVYAFATGALASSLLCWFLPDLHRRQEVSAAQEATA